MWTLSQIPAELTLFYGCWLIFLTSMFYVNSKRPAYSFALGLGLVLVASEYWELPIFLAGFFGVAYWWPYPTFTFLLHHILVSAIFATLIVVRKPKMRMLTLILAIGFLVNCLLLLPWYGNVRPFHGWIARFVGIILLSGGFLYGAALVGS